MTFCLLPKHADTFLEKIKSGELDPDALMAMTSAERHATFAEFLGETNARPVNAMFESKLLLKHQQEGIISWAQSVGGLKPEIQRDILARVNRMDRVLEPKELDAFLSDLAAQKLGFGVTMDEAGRISELAKATSEAKAALEAGGDRMDYGRAKVAFSNYVSDLKNAVPKPRTLGGVVSETAGFSKAIKAAFDNSALFRQGWKTLFSHPEIWGKNAKQSFVDLVQQFGGKPVLDEVNAEIYSRPNAINSRYGKAKLALGNIEEAFPTTLPEKIPGVGRVYKASEAAFTAFQYRTRADVFDKYMEIAETSGVELDKPQLESIGRLVNSLTARGEIGKAEVLNPAFFSLRKLRSDFDFLTGHNFDPNVTPFVRKQAAVNLVKVATGTAAILVVANAASPGSVNFDPRSSDFGKIKVGDTRFDVTGGMGSMLTLSARIAMHSTKNAQGKVVPLGSKSGERSGSDLVYNYFENKLSPAASVVKDILKGQTFEGEQPTLLNEAKNLFVPLPASTFEETFNNPNAANTLLVMLADGLGISANTYAPKKAKR